MLVTEVKELVNFWHPERNRELSPADFTYGSNKKVWWKCANGHEWERLIKNQYNYKGCPVCKKNTVMYERLLKNAFKVGRLIDLHPEVAKEFSEKNQRPIETVSIKDQNFYYWECSKCSFEWRYPVYKNGTKTIPTDSLHEFYDDVDSMLVKDICRKWQISYKEFYKVINNRGL